MKRPVYTVLSIDGGGIRGIIPAKWLEKLQQRLEHPLCEYFDLVVGSSTGALLAAAVALEVSPTRVVALFKESGADIFPDRGYDKSKGGLRSKFEWLLGPKYEAKPMADVLERYFSDENGAIPFGRAKSHCAITAYDVLQRKLEVLQSWDRELADVPIWEVCKASCSAPAYFPAHVIEIGGVVKPLIDGGVAANNPSSLAIAEAVTLNSQDDLGSLEKARNLLLVSMGTGNLTKKISVHDAERWGGIDWAFPILDVVFDGNALAVERVCEAVLAKNAFFRFQVKLEPGQEALDNATEENVNELLSAAAAYIQDDGAADLDRLVVELRRRRERRLHESTTA